MELTPERMQQIEQEEKQRLAEEQYREQVRMNLRAPSAPSAPAPAPAQKKSHAGWLIAALAGVIVLAVIIAALNGNSPHKAASDETAPSAASRTPSVRYVPASEKIASGQIVVRASGYVQYRFQVTPEMRDAHVTGHFNASGGAGNDVQAVIATEDEFTNWANGHQARVFYSTGGKKTTDSFDVRLGPGTYYFAVSNQFSSFSSKDVFLEVDLNYQRMETY